MDFLWMIFWEIVFVVFILPWAWLPIVLELWNDDESEPRWVRWIINQAIGNFKERQKN